MDLTKPRLYYFVSSGRCFVGQMDEEVDVTVTGGVGSGRVKVLFPATVMEMFNPQEKRGAAMVTPFSPAFPVDHVYISLSNTLVTEIDAEAPACQQMVNEWLKIREQTVQATSRLVVPRMQVTDLKVNNR